jgi:hypothetical protein
MVAIASLTVAWNNTAQMVMVTVTLDGPVTEPYQPYMVFVESSDDLMVHSDGLHQQFGGSIGNGVTEDTCGIGPNPNHSASYWGGEDVRVYVELLPTMESEPDMTSGTFSDIVAVPTLQIPDWWSNGNQFNIELVRSDDDWTPRLTILIDNYLGGAATYDLQYIDTVGGSATGHLSGSWTFAGISHELSSRLTNTAARRYTTQLTIANSTGSHVFTGPTLWNLLQPVWEAAPLLAISDTPTSASIWITTPPSSTRSFHYSDTQTEIITLTSSLTLTYSYSVNGGATVAWSDPAAPIDITGLQPNSSNIVTVYATYAAVAYPTSTTICTPLTLGPSVTLRATHLTDVSLSSEQAWVNSVDSIRKINPRKLFTQDVDGLYGTDIIASSRSGMQFELEIDLTAFQPDGSIETGCDARTGFSRNWQNLVRLLAIPAIDVVIQLDDGSVITAPACICTAPSLKHIDAWMQDGTVKIPFSCEEPSWIGNALELTYEWETVNDNQYRRLTSNGIDPTAKITEMEIHITGWANTEDIFILDQSSGAHLLFMDYVIAEDDVVIIKLPELTAQLLHAGVYTDVDPSHIRWTGFNSRTALPFIITPCPGGPIVKAKINSTNAGIKAVSIYADSRYATP